MGSPNPGDGVVGPTCFLLPGLSAAAVNADREAGVGERDPAELVSDRHRLDRA
jgi:hypothetical protein